MGEDWETGHAPLFGSVLATGCAALLAAAPLAADPCLDKPDMQQAQACVRASAQAADAALGDAYRRLRARLSDHPTALQRLPEVERAWQRYRDAHLATRFPAANPRLEYGSLYPLCAALAARDLTRARVRELERWPGACDAATDGRHLAASLEAIRRDYAGDSEFLGKLAAAQDAWRAFSTAESSAAASLRPAKDCAAGNAASRALALAPWLRGVEEGDVCAGSIRVRTRTAKRDVPTVVVHGERKKTIGTIRELVGGDRACYVTLTDDNGERFDELAGFELCDRGRDLLGRRVRLRYVIANVLAASCQGDMDCGKSDTVVLIREATALPPAR
jgi:uncharacterized protein YecT (DUF1311 family)